MSVLTGKTFKYSVRSISILFLFLLVLCLFFFKVEDKVPAIGKVENEQQIVVRSLCEKTLVSEILKEAGGSVKKDEIVMRFSDILNLYHQIKDIELKLAEGKTSFKRMTKLHKANLISDAQYEKLQLQIDLAENRLEQLKKDYDKLNVKAPFEGILTNFHIDLQEPVRIGTELFTVIGKKSKVIRCIAPQALAFGLEKGQKVNIKSKLKHYLKYRVYEGYLKSVSPYGVQDGEAVHYELIIGITDGQKELPVGSTALCEIIKGKEPLIYVFLKSKVEK
jgi:hypothetical protein